MADFENADDLSCTVFGDEDLVISLNPLEKVVEAEIFVEFLVS